MEKEKKNQRPCKPPEIDLFLQWGNRKGLRCVRVRELDVSDPSNSGRIGRKISSCFLTLSQKETSFPPPPSRLTRNSETPTKNRKSSASPKKEERFYTTRASVVGLEENGKVSVVKDKEGKIIELLFGKVVYCFVKQREREEFYGDERL